MTAITHPVGSNVLVNNEVPGVVIEAQPMPGTYTAFNRPFEAYLIRFEDGSEEGFTGDYLTAVNDQ